MLVTGRQGVGCGGCQHANMGMGCLGCPNNKSVNGLGDTVDVPMPATDMGDGGMVPIGTVDTTVATGGGGSGFNWTALTSAITQFGGQVFKAFGPQPSLIPGTNVVYNPQTGQYVPATGLSLTPAFGGSIGGLSLTTIALLGIVAVVVLGGRGK